MNDDDLGTLLTDTFRSRESQVDPDRAVELARQRPRSGRDRRPVAAAVVLLALTAGGVVGLAGRGGDDEAQLPLGPGPISHPSTESPHPDPRVHTVAENRAYAESLVSDVMTKVRAGAPDGAREVTADDVDPLKKLTTFSGSYGGKHDVDRSLFFLVPGDAHALARWYVAHPIDGFVVDGADAADPEDGVGGGSLPAGGWSYDVYLYAPAHHSVQGGASIQLQTTQVGDQAGVRVTIFGSWYPPRPRASYADDVTSVTVTRTTTRYGAHRPHSTRTSWIIEDADRVAAITRTFDGLAGWVPFFHSCPMIRDVTTYRVVMHSPHGDMTFVDGPGCYDVGKVRRDGHRVGPWLASAHTVTDLVDDARP